MAASDGLATYRYKPKNAEFASWRSLAVIPTSCAMISPISRLEISGFSKDSTNFAWTDGKVGREVIRETKDRSFGDTNISRIRKAASSAARNVVASHGFTKHWWAVAADRRTRSCSTVPESTILTMLGQRSSTS